MASLGWDEVALQELARLTNCEKVEVESPGILVTLWIALLLMVSGLIVTISIVYRCIVLRNARLEDEKDAVESPRDRRKQCRKKARTRRSSDFNQQEPDLRKAQEHLVQTSPVDKNNRWRSIWSTSTTEIGFIGGPGMSLYFEMLVYLGLCFTYMFILSLPLLVFSALGNFAPPSAGAVPQSMIANLGTESAAGVPQENRLVVIRCHALPVRDLTKYFGWLDFLGIVLFTVCAVWMRFRNVPNKEKRIDEDSVTSSDYTIEVDCLPRRITDHGNYEFHLRNHIKTRLQESRSSQKMENANPNAPEARVCEIVLVRDHGMTLGATKKRAKLMLEKDISDWKGDTAKSAKTQERIDAITASLSGAGGESQRPEELDVLRAFVTLHANGDVHGLLQQYRFAHFGFLRRFQRDALRFQDTPIRMKRAPEPTNILWDNQDAPCSTRLKRKALVLLICVVIVLSCLGVMFATSKQARELVRKYEQRAGEGQEECPATTVKQQECSASDWTVEKVNDDWVLFNSTSRARVEPQGKDQMNCFCARQGLKTIAQNKDLRSACKELIKAYGLKLGITILAAIIVVTINVAMSTVLFTIAEWELPLSISELHGAQMTKVFISQTLNTAFVVFAVHYSDFNDFERGWYMTVGSAVCMTMATNTVINAVTYFALWALPVLKRRCTKIEGKHQAELLELYTNPPFDMASRYAYLLMTVYVTVIYSAGLPILNFLAMLYCIISFWSDKMILLWASSRPPHFDTKMPKETANWLILAGLIHCFAAVAMFGHPCVFPSNPLGGELGKLSAAALHWGRSGANNVQLVGGNQQLMGTVNAFFDRLGRDSTWMFAVMLFGMLSAYCACGFLKVMGSTVGTCLRLCCPAKLKGSPMDASVHLSWSDAKLLIEQERPPANYRLEEHPDYQMVSKYMPSQSSVVPGSP